MIIKKQNFIAKNQYCVLPNNLAISYALAISVAGNAKNIFLAGFDGYSKRKYLNFEMDEFLKLIKEKCSHIKFKHITPTKYLVSK